MVLKATYVSSGFGSQTPQGREPPSQSEPAWGAWGAFLGGSAFTKEPPLWQPRLAEVRGLEAAPPPPARSQDLPAGPLQVSAAQRAWQGRAREAHLSA